MMKAAAIKPPTTMRVVKDSMTNHRIKIGRILFQSPKMSNPCTMAKSRTSTKIVMEKGSARASTTPARLIIRNELIMRWTLATAYPAEMLGAPRQNLRGMVESG